MAKKRTNGEGTIRQRETGLWECTIMDGFQPNGKRKYKSFYGNTQAEVKKKMKAYLKAKVVAYMRPTRSEICVTRRSYLSP